MSHDEEIRREFAKQAPTFEDPGYTFADRRLLGWIQDNVPAEAGVSVLDVAGGTGHMARTYAAGATVAVVLDLTAEMLALGQRQAQAEGRRNVVFVHGDAAHMPFVDDAFDLVLSRFAVHHFERPEEQVSEMVRVCRPDGRIAIIDLVAPDPASAPVRASSTRPSTITGCRSSAGSPRRRRPQTGRRQSEPSSPPSWRAARRPGCAPSSRTGSCA